MSEVPVSGGATALAERPGEEDDEFTLDVRVLVAYGPIMGDCPTDDGCGNTCSGNDSSCNSFADDPS
ncbi:FxLD family lanthipeptide [Frankia sp. Cas3]|uniref:FxLD family lanthipeptide n=1 Tax=Frankia sp. Cas3 TaxID=3073926 RepID=UPI002AD2891F|nr:FxLD family lanthipeptide [Frankia sp. Cas3]